MADVRGVALALLLSVSGWGCTFIASCPTDTGQAGASNGSSGSNGSGAGNSDAGTAPIPTGEWTNVTGNLADMPSECGNVAGVSAKPDEDMLIVGIALNGLFASTEGGGDWQPLGTGKGSTPILNRMSNILYDPDDSAHFWENGTYSGPGVFETTDNGLTFHSGGDVSNVDLFSADLSDPKWLTQLAGAHEQAQSLHRSLDGGKTWQDIGAKLPAKTNCTFPLVIDAKTYLVGCGGYGGGPSGIYRSTDDGKTWTQQTSSGGAGPALRALDNSIYWVSPNGAVTRSEDDGETWVDTGGPNSISGSRVIELPDRRLAALGQKYVVVSADRGATWVPASSPLPFAEGVTANGLTYSPQQKAFIVWYFTCGFNGAVPVPKDALMRYDFDYMTE